MLCGRVLFSALITSCVMPGGTGTSNGTTVSFLCKRCRSKVVTGIKCINCECLFHNRCAKLTNNVEFIDDDTIKCCEKIESDCDLVNDSDDNFFDALKELTDENNKIDIRIFKYVVKQKDELIKELQERAKVLTQHVDKLTKDNEVLKVKLEDSETFQNRNKLVNNFEYNRTFNSGFDKYIDRGSKQNTNTVNNKVGTQNNVNTNKTIVNDKTEVCETSNAQNGRVDGEFVNTASLKNDSVNVPWSKVIGRKEKRALIVGNKSNEEAENSKLIGVPKTVALHVYRLSPNTTEEQVVDFLKHDFSEVKCEKLKSRNPDLYSSFKVEINENNLESALNANIWPTNARVRRFLYPRLIPVDNK